MTAIKCSEEVLAVAEGNNKFFLDFQSKQDTVRDDNCGGYDKRRFNYNIFYSGISISSVLTMLWDSYKDKRSSVSVRLLKYLQLNPEKQNYITNGYSEVMRGYEDAIYGPQDTVLNIVNKMYTCLELGPLDAAYYRDKVLKHYRCGHESISFSNPTATAEKINDDFSKATKGLVKQTVDKDTIQSNSKIVLVSSFYLTSIWEEPFDPKLTKTMDFTQGNEKIIKVQMMIKHRVPGMSYTNFREMGCHACCMYFEGFRYCMIVVRPKVVKDFYVKLVKYMKTDLSPENLIAHFKRYHKKTRRGDSKLLAKIWLPRFRIQSYQILNQRLQQVENSPWSKTESTLFPDAFENLPKNANPSLTQIVQRCYIDINETGANHDNEEAKAPAVPTRSSIWDAKSKCVKMKLDRCFYFVLYDYTNNFLIAAGFVNDPNEGL